MLAGHRMVARRLVGATPEGKAASNPGPPDVGRDEVHGREHPNRRRDAEMNEQLNNEQITVIGAGTHIKGEMTFDRTARILGSFEGKISSNGEIQIGETAKCKAAIDGEVVRIDGTVEGDVVARECVHLSDSARMTGDVVASKMIVAEGANFLGHCRVGPDAVKNMEPRASRSVEKAEGPQVETRPVDMARSKLADAQARLARMGSEAETVASGDEAAA